MELTLRPGTWALLAAVGPQCPGCGDTGTFLFLTASVKLGDRQAVVAALCGSGPGAFV